jgi:hypothetical protein
MQEKIRPKLQQNKRIFVFDLDRPSNPKLRYKHREIDLLEHDTNGSNPSPNYPSRISRPPRH